MQVTREALESVLGKTQQALLVEAQCASVSADGPYHRTVEITARPVDVLFGDGTTPEPFTCRYSEGLPHRRGNANVSPLVTGSGLEAGVQRGDRIIVLLAPAPAQPGPRTLLRIEPASRTNDIRHLADALRAKGGDTAPTSRRTP